jgi:hypothetical protein
MYFLTKKMSDKDIQGMQKLLPRHHFVEQWRNIEDDAKDLAKQLVSKEYAAPSATWKLLMATRPELILFLDVTTRQSAVEQKIKAFLTKWPQYRQKMPLQKMAEMRITPDLPVYQQLLEQMFFLMLDGKLKTEPEIVKFLEPHQPPLPVAPPTPTRRGRGKKKAAAAAAAAKPAQPAEGAPAPPPGPAPAQAESKPVAKAAKKQAAASLVKAGPPTAAPKPASSPQPAKAKPTKAPAAPARKAQAGRTAKATSTRSAKRAKPKAKRK